MARLAHKTFEYAIDHKIPQAWLDSATKLWNDALHVLEWRQHYLRVEKVYSEELQNYIDRLQSLDAEDRESLHWGWDIRDHAKIEMYKSDDGEWGPACRIARDHRIDRTKSWDKANLELRPSCDIVPIHWSTEPPINGYTAFSLISPFRKKRGYDCSPLPTALSQYVINSLAKAWKEYLGGNRGKPRYKGRRNAVRSIGYEGFRNHCKLLPDGTVKLMGMDPIRVPGLQKHLLPLISKTKDFLLEEPTQRLLDRSEKTSLEEAAEFYSIPGAYCLISRDGKTYLQLSGQFVTNEHTQDKAIEIQTGTAFLIKTEKFTIHHVDNRRIEQRIVALQKVLSKKKYGSNNWQKVHLKIKSLQGKARRRVKAQQAHYAHWLTRSYSQVTITSPREIIPVPEPIPDNEGGYLPNGAGKVAEMNRERASAATAQFVQLLKQGADVSGCDVIDKREKTPKKSKKSKAKAKKAEATKGKKTQAKRSKVTAIGSKKRKGRNRPRERAIG